jgi:hypothetical protein
MLKTLLILQISTLRSGKVNYAIKFLPAHQGWGERITCLKPLKDLVWNGEIMKNKFNNLGIGIISMSWKPSEDVERDKERVIEYEKLYGGFTVQGPLTVELRTGIIVAARFADKLRRAAFAAFSRTVPEDVILRDIAELNRLIYEEMMKMNIDKLALVRISVVVIYDQRNNKLNFSNIKIERLYTEDELNKVVSERCRELEQKLERIKSIIG